MNIIPLAIFSIHIPINAFTKPGKKPFKCFKCEGNVLQHPTQIRI